MQAATSREGQFAGQPAEFVHEGGRLGMDDGPTRPPTAAISVAWWMAIHPMRAGEWLLLKGVVSFLSSRHAAMRLALEALAIVRVCKVKHPAHALRQRQPAQIGHAVFRHHDAGIAARRAHRA